MTVRENRVRAGAAGMRGAGTTPDFVTLWRDYVRTSGGRALIFGQSEYLPAVVQMGNIVRNIDPDRPDPNAIAEAARCIRAGGVVIVPTRCLYGLAADAFNPAAVARVFQIKRRPAHKPVLLLVESADAVPDLVTGIPESARRIMTRFWPGAVTLVFAAAACVPDVLTAGSGKIGIRLAGHPVAAALAAAAGRPVTGTSANIAGQPGVARIADLPAEVLDAVGLALDAGELAGGAGSTVIDVTTDPPTVLREGTVSADALNAAVPHR